MPTHDVPYLEGPVWDAFSHNSYWTEPHTKHSWGEIESERERNREGICFHHMEGRKPIFKCLL